MTEVAGLGVGAGTVVVGLGEALVTGDGEAVVVGEGEEAMVAGEGDVMTTMEPGEGDGTAAPVTMIGEPQVSGKGGILTVMPGVSRLGSARAGLTVTMSATVVANLSAMYAIESPWHRSGQSEGVPVCCVMSSASLRFCDHPLISHQPPTPAAQCSHGRS